MVFYSPPLLIDFPLSILAKLSQIPYQAKIILSITNILPK